MRLALTAAAAVAALLVTGAAGYQHPPQSRHIWGNAPIILYADGLTPGARYAATFQGHSATGDTYTLGGDFPTPVRSNGTIRFEIELADLTYSLDGPLEEIVMWLRPPRSAVNVPPSLDVDGRPLIVEIDLY